MNRQHGASVSIGTPQLTRDARRCGSSHASRRCGRWHETRMHPPGPTGSAGSRPSRSRDDRPRRRPRRHRRPRAAERREHATTGGSATSSSATGWDVRELVVARRVAPAGRGGTVPAGATVGAVPDGGLVLLDGLIASAARAVLVPESPRLRLVVLVHMPFGDVAVAAHAECAVLTQCPRRRHDQRVDAGAAARPLPAAPGAGARRPARGGPGRRGARHARRRPAPVRRRRGARTRGRTCCSRRSSRIASPSWRCTVVGSARPRSRRSSSGSAARPPTPARPTGSASPGHGRARSCARQYQAADVLVLPSRLEAYGMVVTEALAVGLPVIAAAVGGVPEALGRTADGLAGPARAPRRRGRPRRGARHLAARRRPPGAAAPGGP